MRRWGSLLLAAAAVSAYLLVGAPSATGGTPAACPGTPDATIQPNGTTSWSPNTATLPLGSMVCWLNNTGIHHTVTSDTGAWATGQLDPGAVPPTLAFEHTFSTPGTYQFHCSIHVNMIGTIFVPPTTVSATTSPVTGSDDVNPTISGTAPPSSTVNVYEGPACGTLIDATTSDGSGNWSYTVSAARSLTSGTSYQFFAKTKSPSNGVLSDCSTSSASYMPGTSGPDIQITGGPSTDGAVIPSRTPTWTFVTNDVNPVTFECSVDQGLHAFSDCSAGTFTPTNISTDDTWTLAIRATDHTTSNETVKAVSFVVDTFNPKISGPGRTKARRPAFKLSGDANFADFIYACKFDGAPGYNTATGVDGNICQPPSRLRPGKHVLRAHAVDNVDGVAGPDKIKRFTILR